MKKLLILLGVPALPVLALAQEAAAAAADEPINPVLGAVLGLVALAIPFLLKLKSKAAAAAKAAAEKIENEYVQGLVRRLAGEVDDLTSLVGTAAAEAYLDTRRPESPGGSATTKAELEGVGKAILAKLSDKYGGLDKLLDVAMRVGLGDNPAQAQAALLDKINLGVAKTAARDERLGNVRGP